MYLVASYSERGVRQLSAGFPTMEAVTAFLRSQIGDAAISKSLYVVVTDADSWEQQVYLTRRLVGCALANDWSGAIMEAE